MARYGKRKFSGTRTRSVRRRVSRPRYRSSARRIVAKKRYSRRSRRTKRAFPRALVRNGRFPAVAYALQATFNWIATGTGATGVASPAGGGLNTQVPKGYDSIARLYNTAQVYASKATFTLHNQEGDENYVDGGTLYIRGAVDTNKVTHDLPTIPEHVMTCTIPNFRHKLVRGGPGATSNIKSITKKFSEKVMSLEDRTENELGIDNLNPHVYEYDFGVIADSNVAGTKNHTV
eukprot:46367-Pleurochrysis_carterae.AAC.4